jgi:hypothetical protein
VFYRFIFGKHYFIFNDIGSDTINFYIPSIIYFADHVLKNYDFNFYTFSHGIGNDITYFYLFDPFIYALKFFDRDNYAAWIIYAHILKIFTTGLIFFRLSIFWFQSFRIQIIITYN